MDATKLYFGQREVKSWGEGKVGDANTGLVWVEFVDGSREVMQSAEWDCKSEAPVNEDFDFDRRRLQPAVQEILNVVKKYNIRLEDMMTLFTLCRDSWQMAVNQAKELAFGQVAWLARVDDVQKVIDEAAMVGKKPTTTVLRKVQGAIIDY